MTSGERESAGEDVVGQYRARLESLIDTYWAGAVSGEHKSAELVRRLLAQHAGLFGIGGTGGVISLTQRDDGDDELAKLRARRAAG